MMGDELPNDIRLLCSSFLGRRSGKERREILGKATFAT